MTRAARESGSIQIPFFQLPGKGPGRVVDEATFSYTLASTWPN
jgi:hypothetical protein